MNNLENFSVSDLSLQHLIDIDGGVPPSRDTSLANDVGYLLGRSAAGWTMLYHEIFG